MYGDIGPSRDGRARTDAPEDLIAALGKLGGRHDRAVSEHASWLAQTRLPSLDEMIALAAPSCRKTRLTLSTLWR
ncbi:MAG TPA: hypothetical protein DCK98_01975 [Chloroflexi bacterium]|nr:hypothetical protein [Chloroflexota bacterium]HAL25859.1 hypothetical protein [Chloroflexota bacterium]